MTRADQSGGAPVALREYLSIVTTLCTLAALLVGGGKVLEQGERTRGDVAKVIEEVSRLNAEIAKQQLQIGMAQGADKLREEQISTIRRDIDTLVRRRQ